MLSIIGLLVKLWKSIGLIVLGDRSPVELYNINKTCEFVRRRRRNNIFIMGRIRRKKKRTRIKF